MKKEVSLMTKEQLELLSHKDITNLLLEEKGAMNTADLFKEITTRLELPKSVFDKKIGDYYTSLTTDKRFVLLEDGKWDLRSRHPLDKIVKATEEDDEVDEELNEIKDDSDDDSDDEVETDNFDIADEEEDFDDGDDDLKDLVILDEDELDMEH